MIGVIPLVGTCSTTKVKTHVSIEYYDYDDYDNIVDITCNVSERNIWCSMFLLTLETKRKIQAFRMINYDEL